MFKIVVFVSGRGSNLQAIINSIPIELNDVEICAVVSNKIDCAAFEIAEQNSIPTYSVSVDSKDNYVTYSDLINVFNQLGVDLIVLAGFLKKIPDEFVETYKRKIINIHPALLPSFGGKGMYGMNVHKAVFESSAKVSGATVHFVDTVYDNGIIIAQESVDISDVDSPEKIAERVLKIEHKLLPSVIKMFAENKITVKENRVYLFI